MNRPGFPRREPNRLAFNAVLEGFLAKHLGGQLEPFNLDDFPGNALKLIHGQLTTSA